MGHINISTAAQVEYWESRSGTPIIFPTMVREDGKRRGSMFPCAPNFGPVPGGPEWHMAQSLPQHGLLRLPAVIPAESVESDAEDGSFTRAYRDEFGGTTAFPWRFIASIRYIYNALREQLIAQLAVTRRRDCAVPGLMPLSGGFHPYFATEGGSFEILWGGDRSITSNEDFSTSRSFPQRHGIMLVRGNHVIHILPCYGFERFVVWSDDVSKYICIEPTFGTHDAISLRPGQMYSTLCMINYHFVSCR